ncbi:MAG: ABC transporter permease [Candidatus Nomurabacteria bacterium]|jgi:putative ABC transport system permease protein|nr:ABC transporter permease [Candidatus Nomurabacteria bacterium]
MSLRLSFRLARQSLKAHRTRTFLTILGIVIGGFVITLILVVGAGLNHSITRQVDHYDHRLILVKSGGTAKSGLESFNPFNAASLSNLHSSDLDALKNVKNLTDVSPMMQLSGSASSGAQTYQNITTVATDQNLAAALNLKIGSGNWLTDEDAARDWVVLGSKLADGLLQTDQALGQTVTLKGRQFIVIGILSEEDQPLSLAGLDVDKAAFVSLDSGRQLAGGDDDSLSQIVALSNGDSGQAAAATTKALAKLHPDQSDFQVQTASEAARATAGWVATIQTAALIFAAISLLVGGISTMNIMLVSVTERTREIGIRKAVGATRGNILGQFLIEALLLTLSGGLIGLIFGYGAAYIVNLQFSLPMVFDWWIFALSLGAPLAVGLIFGLWPAARAAHQDPIVALRQYN